MSKKRITIMGILILFNMVLSTSVYAQKEVFNGAWIRAGQQKVSGELFDDATPVKVTISQVDKSLQLTSWTPNTRQGDTTMTEVFTQGKSYETKTISGRKKIISVQWTTDKKMFTETATIYSLTEPGKIDAKQTDTWTIENGQLVLDRKAEGYFNNEFFETKAIYDKYQ